MSRNGSCYAFRLWTVSLCRRICLRNHDYCRETCSIYGSQAALSPGGDVNKLWSHTGERRPRVHILDASGRSHLLLFSTWESADHFDRHTYDSSHSLICLMRKRSCKSAAKKKHCVLLSRSLDNGRGLTDGVWYLMNECWQQRSDTRPLIIDVVHRLIDYHALEEGKYAGGRLAGHTEPGGQRRL